MSQSPLEVSPQVQVDRTVSSIGAAIRRLTLLLDTEPEVAEQVALELTKIGPYAAGPMAAALRRSKSNQQKFRIIQLLVQLGPQVHVIAGRALLDLLNREKDPLVRQVASTAQTALIMRGVQESAANRPRP
jgi:hypothetical protein